MMQDSEVKWMAIGAALMGFVTGFIATLGCLFIVGVFKC